MRYNCLTLFFNCCSTTVIPIFRLYSPLPHPSPLPQSVPTLLSITMRPYSILNRRIQIVLLEYRTFSYVIAHKSYHMEWVICQISHALVFLMGPQVTFGLSLRQTYLGQSYGQVPFFSAFPAGPNASSSWNYFLSPLQAYQPGSPLPGLGLTPGPLA